MHDDPPSLEPTLRSQRANGLDAALLNRLEAAVDGSLLELSALEKQYEADLRGIRPAALSPGVLDALEQSTRATPFPTASTVVPFHKKAASPRQHAKQPWWSAAAAVALLGAAAALLLPGHSPSPLALGQAPLSQPRQGGTNVLANPAPNSAVPASLTREVAQAVDQGIVWPDKHNPHRVIKVLYTDKIKMQHDDGTSSVVEQPRVEYYIVPVEAD